MKKIYIFLIVFFSIVNNMLSFNFDSSSLKRKRDNHINDEINVLSRKMQKMSFDKCRPNLELLLNSAIESNDYNTVGFLINNYNIDIDILNNKDNILSLIKSFKMLQLLIDFKKFKILSNFDTVNVAFFIDSEYFYAYNLVFDAVYSGNIQLLKILFKYGAKANLDNLVMACGKFPILDMDIISILLKNGGSKIINDQDCQGLNPMSSIILNTDSFDCEQRDKIIKLFLSYGAKLDVVIPGLNVFSANDYNNSYSSSREFKFCLNNHNMLEDFLKPEEELSLFLKRFRYGLLRLRQYFKFPYDSKKPHIKLDLLKIYFIRFISLGKFYALLKLIDSYKIYKKKFPKYLQIITNSMIRLKQNDLDSVSNDITYEIAEDNGFFKLMEIMGIASLKLPYDISFMINAFQ